MIDPEVVQNSPNKVNVKKGEKYASCTCSLSANQSFCDGTLRQIVDLKPLLFVAKKDEKMFIFGYKQTDYGTHKSL